MVKRLIVLLLLIPSVVSATPECKLQPVTSPCSGTLMPLSLSTESLVCLKTCEKKWKIKLKAEQDHHALDVKMFGEKEVIYVRTITTLEKIVDKSLAARVAEVEDTPFYKTTEFAFGTGLVVGAVVVTGVVYAVGLSLSSVQKQ